MKSRAGARGGVNKWSPPLHSSKDKINQWRRKGPWHSVGWLFLESSYLRTCLQLLLVITEIIKHRKANWLTPECKTPSITPLSRAQQRSYFPCSPNTDASAAGAVRQPIRTLFPIAIPSSSLKNLSKIHLRCYRETVVSCGLRTGPARIMGYWGFEKMSAISGVSGNCFITETCKALRIVQTSISHQRKAKHPTHKVLG